MDAYDLIIVGGGIGGSALADMEFGEFAHVLGVGEEPA